MRPKNLKFPFSWDSRAPLFLDGVLYVPQCYEQHDLWPKEKLKDQLSLFDSVAIEYCSGNGTWIAEKAIQQPLVLWIAVEKRFDRIQKIWAKKHNLALSNLLVVCGEALVFTKHYLQSNVIDQIFINFPDPWPKARHAKKRVVQGEFVQEITRVSKKGGEAVFVTDDEPYSIQMTAEMLKKREWTSFFSSPFYETEWPEYGTSFFDSLWKEQGKEVRYMKYKKIADNGLIYE